MHVIDGRRLIRLGKMNGFKSKLGETAYNQSEMQSVDRILKWDLGVTEATEILLNGPLNSKAEADAR